MNRKPTPEKTLVIEPPPPDQAEAIDDDVFHAAFALGEHGFTVTGVDRAGVLYYRHPKSFGLQTTSTDLACAYAEWVGQLINHREKATAERVECGCTQRRLAWEKVEQIASASFDRRERILHEMMHRIACRFWRNRLFDAREAPIPAIARQVRLAPTEDSLQSIATA